MAYHKHSSIDNKPYTAVVKHILEIQKSLILLELHILDAVFDRISYHFVNQNEKSKKYHSYVHQFI